jgi:hypothetical protein
MLFSFIIFGYSQKKQLLVFVGEKIEFMKDTVVDTENIGPDDYIVVYKIVKLLSGKPEKDTVSCYTADEWETPPELTKYANALVFLAQLTDGYYCLYYFDVYRTKDNRWASPSYYCKEGYEYLYKERMDKPQRVPFENELSFDISKYSDEYIKKHYPSPYFEIRENRAIAVYGHYLDDLLKYAGRLGVAI